MTESERNLSRSHNPNLNSDNFEHLDEQNRIINLLNPHFDCTDLPLPQAMANRSTANSVSPTGCASKVSAPKNCCSAF